MFGAIPAVIVIGAICYGAIRGAKQQIARSKQLKKDHKIKAFDLLICNCMHKHNIAQREAEQMVVSEGHLPPVGWISYIPKT